MAHYQSILHLPEQARVLAASDYEALNAVKFKDKIWDVQFHPEFNAGIAYDYLRHREEELNSILKTYRKP